MSYILNGINLNTYGVIAGHAVGSNIAIKGCFDLPARTGKYFHSWEDEDSVEPYVASGEMYFAGRDITFSASILGVNSVINNNLKDLYSTINAATGLSVFETPYNSASGFVKSIVPEYMNGGAKIEMTFREQCVNLTGTLPTAGLSNYTIDGIPFLSFGLYLSKAEALHALPELKEQHFTKYSSEGYQIVKRQNKTFEFNGFIIGTTLADFQSKVSALYKLFSSSETRNIKINDEIDVDCFATEGFKVDNVYLYNNLMIANISISLTCFNVNYINELAGDSGILITTDYGVQILI
jgi:hypothetical protein